MHEESPTKLIELHGGLSSGAARVASLAAEATEAGAAGSERRISDADWLRYEGYMTEIFTAFGMELGTPGTERTPERFLQALFDATAGYEGDHKLLTTFPTECRCDAGLPAQPGDRGADLLLRAVRASRAALPRVRARRLRLARADHRDLEADPPRATVRAALHGARASRRADRRGARRADGAARGRRPSGGGAPLHANARRPGRALQDDDDRLARRLRRRARTCGASSSPRSAATTRGSDGESEASDGDHDQPPDRRRRHDRRRRLQGHPRPRSRRRDRARRRRAASALRPAAALEGALEGRRRGHGLARHRRARRRPAARTPDRRPRPGGRTARDDQGETYAYERLLLATGGRPRRLPFGGDDVIYFRTLDDYRQPARARRRRRERRRDRRRLHRLRDRRRARDSTAAR